MDSRGQRRKSYPLENDRRIEIPQRYPGDRTGSLYHCSCSTRNDDSFNDLSYSNEYYHNQTRTWKCHAGAAGRTSGTQRNIVISEQHDDEREDLNKCRRAFDHRFIEIHGDSAVGHRRSLKKKHLNTGAAVNCILAYRSNPRRRGEAKGDSESTSYLGVGEDVGCTAAAAAAASTNARTAGNGCFRRRRRDATASSNRAARRLRREERRARCFARTTIASRRAVVPGCRKKVCYAVITVRSSAVVPRRGCRVRRVTSGRGRTTVQGRPRKSGAPSASSSITAYEFTPRGEIILRLTRGVIVDSGRIAKFDDSQRQRRRSIVWENGLESIFGVTNYLEKSNGSSGSSSPVLGSPNVRLRRRRRCGNGKCGSRDVDRDEPTERRFGDDLDSTLGQIVTRIEKLLDHDDTSWRDDATTDAGMKSKGTNGAQRETNKDSEDPNEDTERYDEFDAAMAPVTRVLSKSPLSDEGIEPDAERRKTPVARCQSPDSPNAGEEDASKGGERERRKAKQKVTRCCSSDSAVLSDEDQVRGWENLILCDGAECESTEGQPRYWRTPSVVVSDYSDYSYLDETYERSDPDLEKYEGVISGTPSQSSSCSCLDCDEIREFQDISRSLDSHLLQVCGRRRHSDSCCACLTTNSAIVNGDTNDPTSRRNSCLASPSPYCCSNKSDSGTSDDSRNDQHTRDVGKATIELLDIPPLRKISDCSTNSSLSGDDFEVTELQPFQRPQVRNYFRDDVERAADGELIFRTRREQCAKQEDK